MPRTHRTNELRSIALHRLIAARLLDDATVLSRAKIRVGAWRADGSVDARYAARWDQLLRLPPGELALALVADTEEMRDLRQCTPFAGVVPPRDWWRIVREVHEDREPVREAR